MRTQNTARRGFTLIELALIVAVMAVIAALAIGTMNRTTPRTRLSGAMMELVARIEAAKHTAVVTSRDVHLVMIQGTDPAQCTEHAEDARCTRLFLIEDRPPRFDLATFDPANPTAQGDVVVGGVTAFGRQVRFGRPADYVNPTYVAPFRAIPALSGGTSEMQRGCPTCLNATRGMLTFTGDGRLRLPDRTLAGTTLLLTIGSAAETRGLVVTAPTGVVSTRFWSR